MGQVPYREPHFLEDAGVTATVYVEPGETSLRAAKARQHPPKPRLDPDRVSIVCEVRGCWREAHEVRERRWSGDVVREQTERIDRLEALAATCRAENDPDADEQADGIDA